MSRRPQLGPLRAGPSLTGVPLYIVLAKRLDTHRPTMIGLASFGAAMWIYGFITHD